MTYGIGAFIGGQVSRVLLDHYEIMDDSRIIVVYDWQRLWLVPAVMAAVVFAGFALVFSEKNAGKAIVEGAEPS